MTEKKKVSPSISLEPSTVSPTPRLSWSRRLGITSSASSPSTRSERGSVPPLPPRSESSSACSSPRSSVSRIQTSPRDLAVVIGSPSWSKQMTPPSCMYARLVVFLMTFIRFSPAPVRSSGMVWLVPFDKCFRGSPRYPISALISSIAAPYTSSAPISRTMPSMASRFAISLSRSLGTSPSDSRR